jgi:hypothetical protein
MNLPIATIAHQSQTRLRLRISEKLKDDPYFTETVKKLQKISGIGIVSANAGTGSILIQEEIPDTAALTDFAKTHGLFILEEVRPAPPTLKKRIYSFFSGNNKLIKSMTNEQMDLPTLIFLILIGTGIYQLIRSDVKMPPWYTAFWYALGVFTKAIADLNSMEDADE